MDAFPAQTPDIGVSSPAPAGGPALLAVVPYAPAAGQHTFVFNGESLSWQGVPAPPETAAGWRLVDALYAALMAAGDVFSTSKRAATRAPGAPVGAAGPLPATLAGAACALLGLFTSAGTGAHAAASHYLVQG